MRPEDGKIGGGDAKGGGGSGVALAPRNDHTGNRRHSGDVNNCPRLHTADVLAANEAAAYLERCEYCCSHRLTGDPLHYAAASHTLSTSKCVGQSPAEINT